MGTEGEPLDGRGDTGRAEGGGVAGRRVEGEGAAAAEKAAMRFFKVVVEVQ